MFVRRLATLCVASALFAPAAQLLQPTAAVAATTCHRWAATGGTDTADGSAARPVRSLQALVSRLEPGQTGCLPANSTYEAIAGNGIVRDGGAVGRPVTIRSGDGGRAKVSGWVHAMGTSHDIVFRNLDFVGSPTTPDGVPISPKSSHLALDGDRLEVRDSDISNPFGICVDIGAIEAYSHVLTGDRADDVVLEGNRIHGCGMSPKLHWTDGDSGVHGIYVVHSLRARIVGNLIHDNRWRGLQTWPKADGTQIVGNVFHRNATHVNIGSALADGYPWYSSNTVVRRNILSGKVSFRTDKNIASIQGYFPDAAQTYGNEASDNCVAANGAPVYEGRGVTATNNLSVADAGYADLGTFALRADSPCAGYGLAHLRAQPVAVAPTLQRSPGSCGISVAPRTPAAAAAPAGTWVYWRADHYTWTGQAWVLAQTGTWMYGWATPQGLGAWPDGSRWKELGTGTMRVAGAPVALRSATTSGYHAVVERVWWTGAAAIESHVTTFGGASWCRI